MACKISELLPATNSFINVTEDFLMLHVFVISLKREKFSEDQLPGKLKITKCISPLNRKKVRERKKIINEEVR